MSSSINHPQLNQVLPFYQCSLSNSSVAQLGNGLINDTYLVRNINNNFVLQRVNHFVFKKPEQVINNAELINTHLQAKKDNGSYPLEPMWQVKNKDNSAITQVEENTWRAIQFIPNCYTVEAVETPEQAHQAATAFGQFSSALSDFSADKLAEIIPNFHHLASRIKQLQDAISKNPKDRVKDCQPLIDSILDQQNFIDVVASIIKKLPVQVTHNDTKINNLLFSKHNEKPIAVIDLDTCMPGYLMHDFGDMVRTCCSNLPEDGTDIDNMHLRMDIFEGLAQGYIDSFSGKMTELEQESLVIGAQLLPFMIGVRFLTDFIDGDNYFHTQYETHNLDRALNQIKLFELLQKNVGQLSSIIFK